jgi:hypothetical protein
VRRLAFGVAVVFCDLGNGRPDEFQFDRRILADAQHHGLFVQSDYRAMEASVRDDVVSFGKCGEHFLARLFPFLGGADRQEIHDREHRDDEKEELLHTGALLRRRTASTAILRSLREGDGFENRHESRVEHDERFLRRESRIGGAIPPGLLCFPVSIQKSALEF